MVLSRAHTSAKVTDVAKLLLKKTPEYGGASS